MNVTPGRKHVIVVDDDPIFREFIETALNVEGTFKVSSVENGDGLFAMLESRPYDCVVLDNDLGHESGLAIGQTIKQTLKHPPPIVMLTGSGSERIATKAFRIGFSDYVPKRNLNKSELISAIGEAISRAERDNLRLAEEMELRRQSRYDGLTGLQGTATTMELLKQRMSHGSSQPFSAIVLEPRGFEELRNQLGQKFVEKVLRELARRLGAIQSSEMVCGHVGPESLIVMVTGELADAALEELCGHVSQQLSFEAEFDRIRLNVSPTVGAARFPNDATDLPALISLAKDAGAAAAAAGRSFGIAGDPSLAGNLSSSDEIQRPPEPQPPAGPVVEGFHRYEERRKERRQRVLKRGKIIVHGLNAVIDCVIRDMSASGARLRVDTYFAAPNSFRLEIVGDRRSRPVVCRWQTGLDIGVEYTSE